jgi:hypothetical protein
VGAESEAPQQLKTAFSKLPKSRNIFTLLHRIYCNTRDIYIYQDYEPIEIAASFGFIDCFQGLIDQSFGGSTENYDYGHIPLIAIEFEHIALVRYLIKGGASPYSLSSHPLLLAHSSTVPPPALLFPKTSSVSSLLM